MQMDMQSMISRNDAGHLSNPVGDEVIILNLETGDYLGLNAVGSAIWEALSHPQTVASLIGRLMTEFNVDEETCTRDTLEYLEKIGSLGLLQVHD